MSGKSGNIKTIRWNDSLEFKELALCEKCQEKYQYVWDYGMNVIARSWREIKDQ